MAPKTSKDKGVAKDARAKEPPESELAARRTQFAYFPLTVDAVHLRDYFKPLWVVKTGGEMTGHPATRPPSADREDIDTVIEDVAKDAAAEADKIAAEEAAKGAAEDAAKGSAGESGKAAAEEAGTASTRAPTDGEVFDEEVLAAAGLEVVNEPSAGGGGSQEERLLQAMSANLQKLQALHRARQDKIRSRMAVVDKVEADFKERVTETQAWLRDAHQELKDIQGELAQRHQEFLLQQADFEKAQELAREQAAKRHKEALDAQALAHAGKVKELETEHDGLKEQALKVAKEKDTLNGALVEAEGTVLGKAEELSKANDSIKDLKLKLEGLEGTLSEVRAREGTLTKNLEKERQPRKYETANHEDFVKGENL
nr:translation initiation factor IF-2-like [Aegilops tauschii subsp. strangulata]